MPENPALTYRGPESRAIAVMVVLYGGRAVDAYGVITNAETTASEAGQAYADAGPLAWIAWDGNPDEIEFAEYVEPGTGNRVHRRVIKAERVGSVWATVKLHMAVDVTVTVIPRRADFDARDFDPRDFNAA